MRFNEIVKQVQTMDNRDGQFSPLKIGFLRNITIDPVITYLKFFCYEENIRADSVMGEYDVSVKTGEAAGPHLIRTFALVRSAQRNGSVLRIETALPPWTFRLPKDFSFTAIIDCAGGSVSGVKGAQVVKEEGSRALLEFLPGVMEISLDLP